MSTGMAHLNEIEDAVNYLYKHGCKELALLKCTSAYPAPISDANLNTIADLKKHFSIPVGLSDHSLGIGVSIAAAALGADIIERHFVLDKSSNTVDSAFSSSPEEFEILVKETREIKKASGTVHYGPTDSEMDSLKYRRSIYLCRERLAGDILTKEDIKVVRPGLGLEPKYYDWVLGKSLSINKDANTPLSFEDLE
jgi:N-acetylneuraminate synthase